LDCPQVLKNLVRTIIGVALLLASLQLVYWSAVRREVMSLVSAVAPVATLSYDAIEAFPPGRLALRGVRLAVKRRDSLHLYADRVALDNIDLEWLLRRLAGLAHAPVRQLGLQIDGLRPSADLLTAVRGRAGALGVALPFEAVGCKAEAVFDELDYQALGWQEPALDVRLNWVRRPAQREVDIGLRVDRHPTGVLQAELNLVDVSERSSPLSPGMGGARIDQVTVRYDNAEALAQRNAYCADQSQAAGDFVAAHLRDVHELLRGMGVVPDEPIWAAYRTWLEHGGMLTFTAEPAPGVPFSEYPAFAPEDRLHLLGLSLQVDQGAPVPVEAIAARPAAVEFRPLPVEPEPIPDPLVGTGAAENIVDAAPATPQGRPVTTLVPIGFDEVGNHHRERIRIATLAGGRHTGIVLGSTADAIELQITRYGGAARLPIARDQISRIELVRESLPEP
jgi:hypothetical protein